jgi:hypothetical protein
MPKQRGKFALSSPEEAQLHQLIRAQSTRKGWRRAPVVQLPAQGMGVRAIEDLPTSIGINVAKYRVITFCDLLVTTSTCEQFCCG